MKNKWKCWCGHLNTAHSPFKETEYMVGVGKKELTSCKWCDKAIANLNKKREEEPYIEATKAEEKAVEPHPLAPKEPQWLKDKRVAEMILEMELLKLELGASKISRLMVRGVDEDGELDEEPVAHAVNQLQKYLDDLKKSGVLAKTWLHERTNEK